MEDGVKTAKSKQKDGLKRTRQTRWACAERKWTWDCCCVWLFCLQHCVGAFTLFTWEPAGRAPLHPWLWDIPPSMTWTRTNNPGWNMAQWTIRRKILKAEHLIFTHSSRTVRSGSKTWTKNSCCHHAAHLSILTERYGHDCSVVIIVVTTLDPNSVLSV